MRVFITGAEGFIGSHLVEYLVKKKQYKVSALVQYNSFEKTGWLEHLDDKIKKKIKIHFGDVRDQIQLDKLLINQDAVIHLAALIAIPFSYHAPKSYIETNIIGTYNILEAAKQNKLKKILLTSTSEIYGKAKKFPIREEDAVDPRSPYSATKISADQIALSYFYAYNLPITIIRPFNTFGPRQSMRAIIPTIINQIIDQKKTIKLGNLNTKRNFNFVEDIADGYEKALKSKKKIAGEIINLGSKFELKMRDLAEIMLKLEKTKIKIVSESARVRPDKSEILKLQASNYKAKKLLGWAPKVNNLRKFKIEIHKTIKWFKKNRKHYKKQSQNYSI